jgi:hypothetical protein
MIFFGTEKQTQHYDFFNESVLDSSKKNLFVFVLERPLSKDFYSVTLRYLFNTLKILNDKFNIIIVARNGGTKWTNDYVSHPEYGNYAYVCFDKEKKHGKLNAQQFTHSQRLKYFTESFQEFERDYPEIFKNLAGSITSHFIIPALDSKFEIVSDDPKLMAKQKHSVERYKLMMKEHRLVSHCAFIHKPISFPIEFSFYLMEKYPSSWHYGLCHDPVSAWLHFIPEHNVFTDNVKLFWHVDNNRGARRMVGFPISELQEVFEHQQHDKKFYSDLIDNKTRDFVFGGLFIHEIDHRVNSWYNYFDKLDVDGTIRTQTTMRPVVDAKDSLKPVEELKLNKKNEKNKEEVFKFLNDILNHKMIKDTVSYEQYNDELKDYWFTIILRCYYGNYDHLNFRVHNSLYNGIIPLIADDYDEINSQIPKHLRDKIVVKSHKDIEDKIDYYKSNPDEYKQLFFELYDYYINDKFFDKSYYEEQFKNNFFKEIY